ncbi:putative secreted protein [Mycolicibacterium phlei]|nr:putative secreted protein [Mycolicibacterium phlei]
MSTSPLMSERRVQKKDLSDAASSGRYDSPIMSSLKAALAAVSLVVTSLVFPGTATAEVKTTDVSTPVDEGRQLEVHATADCRKVERQCYYTASFNLRTPNGIEGFGGDLWAKQTTELRTSDRMNYLWVQWADNPNTVEHNGGSTWLLTTVYFGGGDVDRFRITGTTQPTDWATGQPKLDADYIVCSHVEASIGGRSVISPDACAQARFS